MNANKKLLMLLCGFVSWPPVVWAQSTIEANFYDFEQLRQAIVEANERPPGVVTHISTFPDKVIHMEDILPVITGEVHISGGVFQPSTSTELGPPSQLFEVAPGGTLQLSNMRVINWIVGGFGPELVASAGYLVMRDISIENVWGSPRETGLGACIGHSSAIVHISEIGQLLMERVTLVDSGTRRHFCGSNEDNGILYNEGQAELLETEIFYSSDQWHPPIRNTGELIIRNSSFKVQSDTGIPSLGLVISGTGERTETVNSVFDGFTGAWCAEVMSLGHNSSSSNDCDWAATGDTVGQQVGLIYRMLPGDTAFHLVPSAAGPLVDTADETWCPENRERLDGNGDGNAGCDRGAVELPPVRLAEGGANGLFYNPDANGHYLSIVDNDFNTLLIWNTFDDEGNQAWIYGTGQLVNGRSMIANAYINVDGRFSLDGVADKAHAESWGTMELELTGCNAGFLTLVSGSPDFGSGRIPLTRLARVKQLGCVGD